MGSILDQIREEQRQTRAQQPTQQAPKPEAPSEPQGFQNKGILGVDFGNLAGQAAGLGLDVGGKSLSTLGTVLDTGVKYGTRPFFGSLAKVSGDLPEFFQGPIYRSLSDERKQAIEDADSYTGAYNALFEGHPWLQLGTELVADPLNLTGFAGKVGKAAKGADYAGDVTKARRLRNVARGLDLADRAQALPITLPAKVIGKGATKIGLDKPIRAGLEVTQRSQAAKKTRDLITALQMSGNRLTGRGLSEYAPDDFIKMVDQRALRGDDVTGIIQQQDDALLGRSFVKAADSGDDGVASLIGRELVQRGLVNVDDSGVSVSRKLISHNELDEMIDTLQLSPDERQIQHDVLGMFADAAIASNPERYTNPDDIYRYFRFQPLDSGDQQFAIDAVKTGNLGFAMHDKQGNPTFMMVTPFGDTATFVHEIGHVFENLAGPADAQQIRDELWDIAQEAVDHPGWIRPKAYDDLVDDFIKANPDMAPHREEILRNTHISEEFAEGLENDLPNVLNIYVDDPRLRDIADRYQTLTVTRTHDVDGELTAPLARTMGDRFQGVEADPLQSPSDQLFERLDNPQGIDEVDLERIQRVEEGIATAKVEDLPELVSELTLQETTYIAERYQRYLDLIGEKASDFDRAFLTALDDHIVKLLGDTTDGTGGTLSSPMRLSDLVNPQQSSFQGGEGIPSGQYNLIMDIIDEIEGAGGALPGDELDMWVNYLLDKYPDKTLSRNEVFELIRDRGLEDYLDHLYGTVNNTVDVGFRPVSGSTPKMLGRGRPEGSFAFPSGVRDLDDENEVVRYRLLHGLDPQTGNIDTRDIGSVRENLEPQEYLHGSPLRTLEGDLNQFQGFDIGQMISADGIFMTKDPWWAQDFSQGKYVFHTKLDIPDETLLDLTEIQNLMRFLSGNLGLNPTDASRIATKTTEGSAWTADLHRYLNSDVIEKFYPWGTQTPANLEQFLIDQARSRGYRAVRIMDNADHSMVAFYPSDVEILGVYTAQGRPIRNYEELTGAPLRSPDLGVPDEFPSTPETLRTADEGQPYLAQLLTQPDEVSMRRYFKSLSPEDQELVWNFFDVNFGIADMKQHPWLQTVEGIMVDELEKRPFKSFTELYDELFLKEDQVQEFLTESFWPSDVNEVARILQDAENLRVFEGFVPPDQALYDDIVQTLEKILVDKGGHVNNLADLAAQTTNKVPLPVKNYRELYEMVRGLAGQTDVTDYAGYIQDTLRYADDDQLLRLMEQGFQERDEVASMVGAVPADTEIDDFILNQLESILSSREAAGAAGLGNAEIDDLTNTLMGNFSAGSGSQLSSPLDYNSPLDSETRFNLPDVPQADVTRSQVRNFQQGRKQSPLTEALREIQATIGNTVQPARVGEIEQTLAPIFQRNKDHLSAVTLVNKAPVRRHLERAMVAETEEEATQALADAVDALNLQWSSFGIQHPTMGKLFDRLGISDREARGVRKAAGRTFYGNRNLDTQVHLLEEAASMEEVLQFQADYDGFISQVEQVVLEHIPDAAGKELGDLTFHDVVRALDHVDEKEAKRLNAFLDKYDLPTTLDLADNLSSKTLKQIQREGIADAFHLRLMKDMGIKNPTKSQIRQMLGKVPNGWREQALLSVRYHFQNVLDMALKSVVYGINPLKGSQSAVTFASRMGVEIPDAVRVYDLRSEIYSPEFAAQGTPSVLGEIPVAGRVLGPIVDFNRGLARSMEDSFRSAAWAATMRDWLREEFLPNFTGEIDRIERAHGVDLSDLRRVLDNRGAEISEEELYQLVVNKTGNVRAAREAATIWGRGVDEASLKGIEMANKVHFDFMDERVVEEKFMVRSWAPFHFWATRNVPFYLQTMTQHPEIMRAWEKYDRISDQERERMGLTPRFMSTLPLDNVPVVDPIFEFFFGEGTPFFNPLVVMSLADQFKPRYVDEDSTAVGRVLDEAGRVGLSPAPWINVALSAAGVYGPDAEAPSFLRHSRLAEAVTGVDVEQPIQDLHNKVQETITGQPKHTLTGDSYMDYQLAKRIKEMSVEETGDANNPAYVQAIADPSSEIFQRALADVQKQRLGNELMGMTNPLPAKYLTDTEATVREADASLGDIERTPEFSRMLAEQGHLATALWGTGNDLRQDQISAGFAASDAAQSADGPIIHPFLQRALGQQAGGADERFPWFHRYLAWRRNQPEGADLSIERFLRENPR